MRIFLGAHVSQYGTTVEVVQGCTVVCVWGSITISRLAQKTEDSLYITYTIQYNNPPLMI